jgi:uncharacterized membrane protein
MLKRARRQRAQAIVWVVVMLPLFLGIAGLSIDAGRIFDARREAQNVADGAARVAAMQIDLQKLHTTGKVQLNGQAAAAARRYVADHTPGSGWEQPTVTPDANGVQVKVTRRLPTTFMRILSPGQEVAVSATARAEPCVGITSGQSLNGGAC